MPILDALTGAIANPMRVRERQEKAAQRIYEGLDLKMSLVRDVSPEQTPGVPSVFDSKMSSTCSSRAPSPGRSRDLPSRRLFRPRPELQRSLSELPIKTEFEPAYAPCITAIDLSPDQIKRNYSVDDLQEWDKAKFPLPPMGLMTGIGRYRTSKYADPEWRAEYFKKQVSDLDGLGQIVTDLDMSQVNGMNCQEWRELTGTISRRGSAISSNSTQTTASSAGLPEYTIDLQSGARVARGFSPSASSSARSSFNAHSRKGSALSVMSKPGATYDVAVQKPVQRTNTLCVGDRRASSPLSTIVELQSNISCLPLVAAKVPRPCEFVDSGDPESAVASDADDDNDSVWTDEPAGVSVITQMLKEGRMPEPTPALTKTRTISSEKRRGRSSMAAIDRSKTIKGPSVPSRRRKSTKINLIALEPKVEEKYQDTVRLVLPTPDSANSGAELVLQIRNPATHMASC